MNANRMYDDPVNGNSNLNNAPRGKNSSSGKAAAVGAAAGVGGAAVGAVAGTMGANAANTDPEDENVDNHTSEDAKSGNSHHSSHHNDQGSHHQSASHQGHFQADLGDDVHMEGDIDLDSEEHMAEDGVISADIEGSDDISIVGIHAEVDTDEGVANIMAEDDGNMLIVDVETEDGTYHYEQPSMALNVEAVDGLTDAPIHVSAEANFNGQTAEVNYNIHTSEAPVHEEVSHDDAYSHDAYSHDAFASHDDISFDHGDDDVMSV